MQYKNSKSVNDNNTVRIDVYRHTGLNLNINLILSFIIISQLAAL